MTEQNKFTKVDSINVYNDNIGYVQLWDASHANESEEQRIWTVTTIASLAYGNESAKNPEALYKRMQEIRHESLWEFIRGFDEINGYTIDDSLRIIDYGYYTPDRYIDGHEQNIACFRIKVPIFVARQFMRHRSAAYLEMSRRYTKDSKVPFEFWFPKNIQRSKLENDWDRLYEELTNKEGGNLHTQVASRFLPQTTYTEFYCMFEVEGLKNFMNLRLTKEAQEEIRTVAQAMADLLKHHQPELYTKVVV